MIQYNQIQEKRKKRNRRSDKYKAQNKMLFSNTNTTMIILNVRELNALVKWQMVVNWIC